MIKFLVWCILMYCLFRFVFNFLIPVLRTAGRMKKQVRDFHEQQARNAGSQPFKHKKEEAPRPRREDYIDFEEVK